MRGRSIRTYRVVGSVPNVTKEKIQHQRCLNIFLTFTLIPSCFSWFILSDVFFFFFSLYCLSATSCCLIVDVDTLINNDTPISVFQR